MVLLSTATTAAREVPRLSPSIAHILISKSPLHAWQAHRLLGAAAGDALDPTEAQRRGTVLDKLLFGVGPELEVLPFDSWRSKDAQAARDAAIAAGKLPVLDAQIVEYGDTVTRIREGLARKGVVLDGESQQPITWESDGVLCKGIPDHVVLARGQIYDLKTTTDASPEGIARSMARYGSHMQAAAYVEAVEKTHPELAGRVRMHFLYCEVAPPYAVTVAEAAGSMRSLGEAKWRRAVRTWRECLASGVWPDYADDVVRIEAKPWMLDEEMTKAAPVEDPDWMR